MSGLGSLGSPSPITFSAYTLNWYLLAGSKPDTVADLSSALISRFADFHPALGSIAPVNTKICHISAPDKEG